MSEHIKPGMPGFFAGLMATCKLEPRTQPIRKVFPAKNWMQQAAKAESYAREQHERLLAEGWTWDGMDGYSKEEKRS